MQTENSLSNAIQPQPQRKVFTAGYYIKYYGIRIFAVAVILVAALAYLNMPTRWDTGRVIKSLPSGMLSIVSGHSIAQQRLDQFFAETKENCVRSKNPEVCYSLSLKATAAKYQEITDGGKATEMDKEKLVILRKVIIENELNAKAAQ